MFVYTDHQVFITSMSIKVKVRILVSPFGFKCSSLLLLHERKWVYSDMTLVWTLTQFKKCLSLINSLDNLWTYDSATNMCLFYLPKKNLTENMVPWWLYPNLSLRVITKHIIFLTPPMACLRLISWCWKFGKFWPFDSQTWSLTLPMFSFMIKIFFSFCQIFCFLFLVTSRTSTYLPNRHLLTWINFNLKVLYKF